jgi:tetratricopeptide (TPR) repeat protein
MERGLKLNKAKQFDEAVNAFAQVIAARPDNVDAYLNRGIAYMNLGFNGQAIADFNKVVELDDMKSQQSYDARTYIEQLESDITPVDDPTPSGTPTSSLRPRVYIQIQKGMPDVKAREVASLLEEAGYIVRLQTVSAVPQNTEVRYYRNDDSDNADFIRGLLRARGVSDAQPRYVIGYKNSTEVRPKHYEIWFSTNSLAPERNLK